VRAVVRICLALLALFFVVAIGLSVVLPRTCGEDVVRVRPLDRLHQTGLASRGPNRPAGSRNALRALTSTQVGGNYLKDDLSVDDISACEGSSWFHSMCG
jgi:hypothetical protein